jgi:hypothetical protein
MFERLELKLPVERRRSPHVVEVRIRNERALGVVLAERGVLTAEPLEGVDADDVEVRTSSGRRLSVRAVTLLPSSPLALLRLGDAAVGDDVAPLKPYDGAPSWLDQQPALELFGFDAAGDIASQRLPPRFVVPSAGSHQLVVVDVEPVALSVPQGAPLLSADGRLVAVKVVTEAQQVVARETRSQECVIDTVFYELVGMWR